MGAEFAPTTRAETGGMLQPTIANIGKDPLRQAPPPFQRRVAEPLGWGWLFRREIFGFLGIGGEVVEFDASAIGVDEQFPIAVAHGDGWAAIGFGFRVQVGSGAAVFPKERAGTGG